MRLAGRAGEGAQRLRSEKLRRKKREARSKKLRSSEAERLRG